MVAYLNISYLRFFAASIVLHFVVFFIVNSAPSPRVSEPETIPVSVLDTPEKEQPALTQVPRIPRTRRENIDGNHREKRFAPVARENRSAKGPKKS